MKGKSKMNKFFLSSILVSTCVIGFSGCGGYSNSLTPSEVQKNINSYSEEDQIKAVEKYSKNIRGIKNPSLKVQEAALDTYYDCRTLGYIQNPHTEIINNMLPNCGSAIKHIKNPTEEQQLLAVKNDYSALYHIKSPSEKVQMKAIEYHGKSISYIENPSEAMKLLAIKESLNNIRYIKNPSKEVRKLYIKANPWFAAQELDIKNLDKQEQLLILSLKPIAIQFFDNPSEEVQLSSIRNAKNFSDYLFNLDNICNLYIKNPTKLVQNECKKLLKFKNLRHNFLKDTMAIQPYFEIKDKNLTIRLIAGVGIAYISNHENKFMKVNSISVYYGEDIYTKKVNLLLPPNSKSKFQAIPSETSSSGKFYIPVKSEDQSLSVGVALEYEVEGIKKTFYKARLVKYKEQF